MKDSTIKEIEALERYDNEHECAVAYKDGDFVVMHFNFYEQLEDYDHIFITGKISKQQANDIVKFCKFIRALK